MAAVYRRQLSDFFLPAPPEERELPHDFRRLTGESAGSYSKALRYQLRQAQARRDLAIDLATDLSVAIPAIELRIDPSRDSAEEAGARVREVLKVTFAEQSRWRSPRNSYNSWRGRIENAGVLVFQIAGVSPSEILGFSLGERPLPVIGINRKVALNGRTFTLLHEFVHVLIGESSLCDIADDILRSPSEQRREVFCNAVAGAALVPSRELLSTSAVRDHGSSEWSREILSALAKTFGVSEHVILRRLLALGLTTPEFYRSQLAIWRAFEASPKLAEGEEFRRNMPQEIVSDLGRPFTRLVLNTYLDDRMSLSDVSRYLGLRAGLVSKVQEMVSGG